LGLVGASPPEAIGGLGVPLEARGFGVKAPSAERFLQFFNQNNTFLFIFGL